MASAGKHSREQIRADARHAARGTCPECLREVKPEHATAHADSHWPRHRGLNKNSDAARRARLVLGIGNAATEN